MPVIAKRLLFLLSAVLLLAVAGVFVLRTTVKHSAAYATASQFVGQSPEVIAAVGDVNEVELSWSGGAHIRYHESNGVSTGNAVFTLLATGDRASEAFRIHLDVAPNGKWQVTKMAPAINDDK
jgi:hypothetical protein